MRRSGPDRSRSGGRAGHSSGNGAPERIGRLLVRLRTDRGLTQRRVADKLVAASGVVTVTRHEVSRWEREDRIPGGFWLRWLAAVLEVPLERLEAAVAVSRGRVQGGTPPTPADQRQLWRPPAASELIAMLDTAPTHDLRELAHTWLTGPPPASGLNTTPAGGTDLTGRLDRQLTALRRYDDLVGGLDLASYVDRHLRTTARLLADVGSGGHHRRLLATIAGYAQLAGWVHSDAGDNSAARRAYRAALRAAASGGHRLLAAHVLASLSHHCWSAGDPHEALLLARTGYAGIRTGGTPLARALLLHRIALAAAAINEWYAAEQALCEAQRLADRADPAKEPGWLYWLDHGELAAMTGRCLVVLGRPVRAVRLLSHPRPEASTRTAALYRIWLARAYLAAGEVELGQQVSYVAVRLAAASGSARAMKAATYLRFQLIARLASARPDSDTGASVTRR